MPPPRPISDLAETDGDLQAALSGEASRTAAELATEQAMRDPTVWRDAVADNGPTFLALQGEGVAGADSYLTDVLVAQGASPSADARIEPAALVDYTDGGGSWLRNLVYAPPATYQQAVAAGLSAASAWLRAQFVASAVAGDGVADAARSARLLSMFGRPAVKSWVRALRGTSCARCAILAGRRYYVSGFQRHPRCDCYMIPSAEDANDDWTTDPDVYFRSLNAQDQNRIFTVAGAEAIRLGADMSQVVNARDGITVASVYGRDVQATLYGTSVRGLYGGYEVRDDGSLRRRPTAETERRRSGDRSLRYATAPRLLPDEIFEIAAQEGWDRDEILRQLRRFAYIF